MIREVEGQRGGGKRRREHTRSERDRETGTLCGNPNRAMGQTASTSAPAPSSSLESKPAQCPIQHSPPIQTSPAKCPVDHNALASGSGSPSSSHPSGSTHPSGPAKCPIDHGKSGELNPLNQMPHLAQERASGQSMDLPLEREVSSIPRANDSSKWEYPSAQQFYNALVRKGWETPEEHVQTMVDIHNFLNEEAWQEIMKWEPPYVLHVSSYLRRTNVTDQ